MHIENKVSKIAIKADKKIEKNGIDIHNSDQIGSYETLIDIDLKHLLTISILVGTAVYLCLVFILLFSCLWVTHPLSSTVLCVLLSTTTVNVLGLIYLATRNLVVRKGA